MIIWQDKLFSYFGGYDKRSDTNKDNTGAGLFERYNKIVGKSMDNEIYTLVGNLMKNIYDPETCFDRYVVYLESMMGFNQTPAVIYLSQNLTTRRNMLKKILKLYSIKGTKRCYSILFGMIGVSMVMTENFNEYGFDSSVTFDDEYRTFDGRCDTCSIYTLALTGPTFSLNIYEAVVSIINFNQPINAVLKSVTYNGDPMTFNPAFNSSFNNSFAN